MGLKSHVKAIGEIKNLFRSLIHLLSYTDMSLVLLSLRVLTSLAVNDALEKKLFNSSNINQTFQLVFNLIINGTGGTFLPASTSDDGSLQPASSLNSYDWRTNHAEVVRLAIDLLSDLSKR